MYCSVYVHSFALFSSLVRTVHVLIVIVRDHIDEVLLSFHWCVADEKTSTCSGANKKGIEKVNVKQWRD